MSPNSLHEPRPIVESAPSPPLARKSPESPLKRPPNKHKILCAISIDTQLLSQYTHPTQKRVLINNLSSPDRAARSCGSLPGEASWEQLDSVEGDGGG